MVVKTYLIFTSMIDFELVAGAPAASGSTQPRRDAMMLTGRASLASDALRHGGMTRGNPIDA
jgi:hypothetical protein